MTAKISQKYMFDLPDVADLQECARQLVIALEAGEGLTELQIAALMGADDAGAARRIKAKQTQKIPAALFAAAGRINAKYIQPYMDLMGLKALPVHVTDAVNALPALGALVGKLAAAVGAGGGIDHIALAGMLTELRDADGAISTLRGRAAEMGMSV